MQLQIKAMKKTIFFFILGISCLCSFAQTSKDYAVLLTATTDSISRYIMLNWNKDTTCLSQEVYRKKATVSNWTLVKTLTKFDMQYKDSLQSASAPNEYYVRRKYANSRLAHGYVYSGYQVAPALQKGMLLLLIDQNYKTPLATEIKQLQSDLIASGWKVNAQYISRSMAVTDVKALINGVYNASSGELKALYLLGRIPVPYSGDIFPDGHRPDHRGAWPADVYYGVMDESVWTVAMVWSDTATQARNKNIPGDGKFDLSYVYAQGNDVALQIGRVDLTNMPSFGLSDTTLTANYLAKSHAFRTGATAYKRRAVIEDNFGAMGGEAFASGGWRNFVPMFGDSVSAGDYLSAVKGGSYLFSYGCGAGNYTSASGIANTTDFLNDSVNTQFTMLFGSYFGDWDAQNNFLRAPLCNKKSGLASVWSGRPHWHFQHMALGEHIGYAAQLTQSNYSDFNAPNAFGYVYNAFPTFVHIALMGDPTLTLYPYRSEQNLKADSLANGIVKLSWTKNTEALAGYVLLRSNQYNGNYTVLKRLAQNDTTSYDSMPFNGKNYYMVRGLKLEVTPSGTFYNASVGAMDSVFARNTTGISSPLLKAESDLMVFPNPVRQQLNIVDVEAKWEGANVMLYDINGRLITRCDMVNHSSKLDMNALQAGIYLLRVQKDELCVTKKIRVE
jgi:hypothetical protein